MGHSVKVSLTYFKGIRSEAVGRGGFARVVKSE